MKIITGAFVLLTSLFAVNAYSAQNISREEVEHFKLEKIGQVNVNEVGGKVGSPSALHKALSDKADEKGGKYYLIIAAREHGQDFEAIAEVYK